MTYTVPNALPVFVSSMCYELRDLRAAIRDFLKSFGLIPMLSEDNAFPRQSGEKPYVTCLRTMEECPLVIGVIEREYGRQFEDWGAYSEHAGLSPTHAELRHAIATGKKLLLYVHRSTMVAYETWRSNKALVAQMQQEHGPQIKTLEMIGELKRLEVPPFIEQYNDVSDVLESLKGNLINEIFASVKDQVSRAQGQARYFSDKIQELSPEIRRQVDEALNPQASDIRALIEERDSIQAKLEDLEQSSQDVVRDLNGEKTAVESELKQLQTEVSQQRVLLTMAAVKDSRWLQLVRTQMMPKQPGRVPFHNAAEVALRGYHASNSPKTPKLDKVTWSELPHNENGLHRGYTGGVLLEGSEFAPGVVVSVRAIGSTEPTRWGLPSIYFGDYLELAASGDAEETPLSYRGKEFAVRNPSGVESAWVPFTYPFDEPHLLQTLLNSAATGRALLHAAKYDEAVEQLRKAMTYARTLHGDSSAEAISLSAEWNEALDKSFLARMRHRVGDQVSVISGPWLGAAGTIEEILVRHLQCYRVKRDDDGKLIQVADNEVCARGSAS